MPILNYTTEVDVFKTTGIIQGMLAAKGARQISIEYDHGPEAGPSAIQFMILLHKQPVVYRLPCNAEGVLRVIDRPGSGVPVRLRTIHHARRVAWRIVKDWTEAQLALVEAQQAQMAEVFLPYAIDDQRQTLFQRFEESKLKLLTAGNGGPE